MRVHVVCPNETCGHRFDQEICEETAEMHCPRCGRTQRFDRNATTLEGILDCPVCGSDELYVRKDFPQRLGLALVVIVAIASFWFFARGALLWALGVLVALLLVDLVIYRVVPKVTVCYRCRAEFRNAPVHPRLHGFDLATAEKYR